MNSNSEISTSSVNKEPDHCESTAAAVIQRFPHLPARFTLHPLALKRIHDLTHAKQDRTDNKKHAEAESVLFRLDQLDKALGKVLSEEGLLFEGAAVTGKDILAELTKD